MGTNSFTSLSQSLLDSKKHGIYDDSNFGTIQRLIYPAVVRDVNDIAGQHRIKAEIVSIDANGRISPGRDKNVQTEKLPICIPLLPLPFHIMPKVGECVILFMENPNDNTSARYYIGPLFTDPLKFDYQNYEDSVSTFQINSFKSKETTHVNINEQVKILSELPLKDEIAMQGRNDADVVFKSKEVLIRAGRLKNNNLEINTTTPCFIQLKQHNKPSNLTGIKNIDNELIKKFRPFAQQNISATNINIYSNEGKFRSADKDEINTFGRLNDFGDVANKLHPAVFGDELIKLLKIILSHLLNHRHTPQEIPLKNSLSDQLAPYLNGGKLYDLISHVVRIN